MQGNKSFCVRLHGLSLSERLAVRFRTSHYSFIVGDISFPEISQLPHRHSFMIVGKVSGDFNQLEKRDDSNLVSTIKTKFLIWTYRPSSIFKFDSLFLSIVLAAPFCNTVATIVDEICNGSICKHEERYKWVFKFIYHQRPASTVPRRARANMRYPQRERFVIVLWKFISESLVKKVFRTFNELDFWLKYI